ncbi:DinB family protein [Psychrobacillus sp. FSL H8-0484]|uniref:DinB family protein n=1 Tax=Psychrobacillus sp. FSL H8-0484 TaxID=2921390 RepID=UPI0030FC6DBD
MFLYNWQIREEWFKWCETISNEELTKKRIGGMGSILHNLFHVIDCEQIWVNQMQGTPVFLQDINKILNIHDVKAFSNLTQPVTQSFIKSNTSEVEDRILVIKSKNGTTRSLSYDKILRHIISHEIHHIGQLSVWAREIGLKPVSSDFIFRELD